MLEQRVASVAALGADGAGIGSSATAHALSEALRPSAQTAASTAGALGSGVSIGPGTSTTAQGSTTDVSVDVDAAAWLVTTPSGLGELAAAPVTPVWVQALQTPALTAVWVPPMVPGPAWAPREAHEAHDDATQRRHARQRRDRRAGRDGVAFEARPDADDEPWADDLDDRNDREDRDDAPAPAAVPERAAVHPLAACLPPLIGAELAQRRGVLLWAPLTHDVSGIQAWWIGFDMLGRARQRRLAARGRGPQPAAWQWWWLKREGDDGCETRPRVRPAAGSSLALALRVGPPTLAPPLDDAGTGAWLDLTDAGRWWAGLGTQWSWLAAWSPRALPWMH